MASLCAAILLLTVLVLLLPDAWAFCEQSSVDVGFLYRCQLNWNDFFEESSPPSADVQVRYTVSLDGAAGLPEWLNLLHTEEGPWSSPAFIYGTPEQKDLGSITLQASLTRLDTFDERTREINIAIQQPQGKILQRSEFYITNYTVDEFLSSDVITRFQQTLSMLYEQDVASVTKVINPLERGILIPPPPDKHGVIVQTTPGLDVAVPTSDDSASVQESCDPSDNFDAPPLNFELFQRAGFEIDWCRYVVYPAPLDGPQEQASRPATNQPPDRDPPSPGGSHISLVVVMVLGFVVVVMAVSGLAMVFFGRRRSSLSLRKRQRRETMRGFIKEATSGPSTAQKHLRDLARSPSANPTRKGTVEQLQDVEVGGVGEEGGLLEFQDVVDYGNGGEDGAVIKEDQTPPPEYHYDEELLSRPLYEPGRRSRLITL